MNSSIVQCDTFALIRRHNCVSRNFYADEFKSCDFGYRGLICYWIHWHWFLAFVARTEAQSIVVLQCECRILFVPKTSSQPQVGASLDRIQFSRGPSKFESDKPSAFHRSIYPKIDLFKLPLPRRSFIILLFHVFWMKPICSGQNLLWCLTFNFFYLF